MSGELVSYSDMERMAEQVVRSGLFPGLKTAQQAMALFLVAQAEGLHPMTAATRYNVIQGRPALKADAMLAEFMRRGGTVEWVEWTNEACEAVFTSTGVPKGVRVRWTMADARLAGVTGNPTWTKYPRQMLKARVASDGVRMADPAVNHGRYTEGEVEDMALEEGKRVAADAEIVEGSGSLHGQPGQVPSVAQRGGPDPDLTEKLEASIAAAEAKKNANLDARCHECASVTEVYASTQSGANAGRKYRQCKFAHDAIIDDMAAGVEQKLAYAAQSKHTREWVEPPRKIGKAQGRAPEEPNAPPGSEPEEPAPSIFDPQKIAADVAAKLAKEAK